jgi:hypothetical protein
MAQLGLEQLTQTLHQLWSLAGAKSPPRGPHALLPPPAKDALLTHLAMGLRATQRILETPLPPDAPAHHARALEELHAAVALLEEWQDTERHCATCGQPTGRPTRVRCPPCSQRERRRFMRAF